MLQIPCRFLTSNWNHVSPTSIVRQISTAGFPLQFNATPVLSALPVKAKKKIDPAILKLREDRKKKKIEKQIKLLKKIDKQLKPIVETEVPYVLQDEPEKRRRVVTVPEEVVESRILLLKEWSNFKREESKKDFKMIQRLMLCQKRALEELRLESEELYQAAVQIDDTLIPFKFSGPSETPRLESYPLPDGDYFDISRKWL